MSLPFIICAAVTLISATVSLGFSIAAALSETGSARTMARYGFARSLALWIGSAVPFVNGSAPWLQAMAWSMIIVQACDAVIGIPLGDRSKAIGPAVLAVVNLLALVWLLRS